MTLHQQFDFESIEQLVKVVDQSFANSNYTDCHALLVENKKQILDCPTDLESWFFLRHGQVLLELNKPDKAKEALCKAFAIDGFSRFAKEENKYFDIIQDYVNKREKMGHIATWALMSSFFVLMVTEALLRHFEIIPDKMSSGWVYGVFFVFFCYDDACYS